METLEEQLKQLQAWLRAPGGEALWHVMTAFRGPDSPSERPDQDGPTRAEQYRLRRERKRDTVEVIRGKALAGASRGARYRQDTDTVILPPEKEWDHFDRHVLQAAHALGLTVQIRGQETETARPRRPKPLVDMLVPMKPSTPGTPGATGSKLSMFFQLLDIYGLNAYAWPPEKFKLWLNDAQPQVTLNEFWMGHLIMNPTTLAQAQKLINSGAGNKLVPGSV